MIRNHKPKKNKHLFSICKLHPQKAQFALFTQCYTALSATEIIKSWCNQIAIFCLFPSSNRNHANLCRTVSFLCLFPFCLFFSFPEHFHPGRAALLLADQCQREKVQRPGGRLLRYGNFREFFFLPSWQDYWKLQIEKKIQFWNLESRNGCRFCLKSWKSNFIMIQSFDNFFLSFCSFPDIWTFEGVQIAYFAIIGTQCSMILLSVVLIFGIYKVSLAQF